MRACIHRGAREIGGTCVEIEHDGLRLVLDLGLPLNTETASVPSLPPVPGLKGGDESLLGVLVSHGHPDHWGLVPEVPRDVPLFIGDVTQRILREAAFFTPMGADFEATRFLHDGQPFSLGPFKITPFLTDHSAYDAYSIMVEAGGRRLFYTGDVRAHGRKSSVFERLIAQPPQAINVLLLEGTHVRPHSAGSLSSEKELQAELAEAFRSTSGLVLVCYSPQNIDRLVTVFKAAKQSGRKLVFDLYAASVAQATGNPRIPQAHWDDVLVYVPNSQRVRVKRSEEYGRTAAVRGHRVYADELADRAGTLVVTFRASMAAELERAGCLNQAQCVWSLWPGYLDNASGATMREWLTEHKIPLAVLHSSGHASVPDLQRLAAALNAERVVPIHTGAPDLYRELFESVEQREDGEWWTV